MMKSQCIWTRDEKLSVCGGNVFLRNDFQVWRSKLDRVVLGLFPPEVTVEVKAIACELPSKRNIPLSKWSIPEIAREACQSGLVASISNSTVWRWLHEDAIKPWQHRCWIFPRDPDFTSKAERVLDLYERIWCGKPLRDDEFVLSADEKQVSKLVPVFIQHVRPNLVYQ